MHVRVAAIGNDLHLVRGVRPLCQNNPQTGRISISVECVTYIRVTKGGEVSVFETLKYLLKRIHPLTHYFPLYAFKGPAIIGNNHKTEMVPSCKNPKFLDFLKVFW